MPPPMRPQFGNLHKRRISTSPQKFNTGEFEPLTVRTDLQLPHFAPPAKRTRTKNKLEIDYDGAGTPRFKETPASIAAGFTPKTTAGFATTAMPTSDIRHSSITIPAPRMITTDSEHLLHWKTKRFKPKRFVKQKGFSLLEAFVKDNSLLMLLVSYLPIPSLIDLYAISMTFHHSWNKHHTAFILASMRTWAPKADEYYPWRCYAKLCVKDPIKRQKAKVELLPAGANPDSFGEFSRDVPSLRWLQMVTWREAVTKDIVVQLHRRGLIVSHKTRDALKRMWFIYDLGLNAHRIALIHSTRYFPTSALILLLRFFVKFDMALTDPGIQPFPFNHPDQWRYPNEWAGTLPTATPYSEKLLAENTMTPLWRVLRGWTWDGSHPDLAILKLLVRHKGYWDPLTTPYSISSKPVMGMLLHDVPLVGAERVYRPQTDDSLDPKDRVLAMLSSHHHKNQYFPRPLLRPDQLVIKELIRREAVANGQEWNFMRLVRTNMFTMKGLKVPSMSERCIKTMRKLREKGYKPHPLKVVEYVRDIEAKEKQQKKEAEEKMLAEREERWRELAVEAKRLRDEVEAAEGGSGVGDAATTWKEVYKYVETEIAELSKSAAVKKGQE